MDPANAQAYLPYGPKEEVWNLVLTQEEMDSGYYQQQTDIGNYLTENLALFVTGGLDPYDDAAWNKYLSDLKSMGTDNYLKVTQAAYTRISAK
jgi:outer membrane protease